jgi:hypothetical protein
VKSEGRRKGERERRGDRRGRSGAGRSGKDEGADRIRRGERREERKV